MNGDRDSPENETEDQEYDTRVDRTERDGEGEVSRRGFLKKAGIGAVGLGMLATPVSGALDFRTDSMSFKGTDNSAELEVSQGGPVQLPNADLDLNNNALQSVDWSSSDTGAGSGLDADTVDGKHASALAGSALTYGDGSDGSITRSSTGLKTG